MKPRDPTQGNFWRFLAEAGPATPTRGEVALGQIALEFGLVTPDQLEACLSKQSRSRSGPRQRIGQLLLDAGHLDATALENLLQEQRKRLQRFAPTPRYEILERLGEGASAVVYRAFDKDLARPVALKILKSSLSSHENSRQRLQREARAAARLAHPNTVTVHDVGFAAEHVFLVMEFVQGRPLNRVVGGQAMDPVEAAKLLEKTARGLQHAHSLNIIHRDLKPANILLTQQGEPKIADFGLARLLDSDQALTAEGAAVGTPIYMAPEQVLAKDVTAQSDVYALGAILYEALTGRPPHQSHDVPDLYRKILYDDPVPPRLLNPKVPHPLSTIVLKALEKETARRYRTAQAFGDDLRNYLEGKPIEAKPPGATRRVFRAASRHRVPVLAIALLAAGVTWYGVSASRKKEQIRSLMAEAYTAEKTRKPEKARDLYRHALDLDSGNLDVKESLYRVETRIKKTADDLVEAARSVERARTHLDTAVDGLFRTSTDMKDLLAEAEEALSHADRALALAPDLPAALYQRGRALLFRGFDDLAEQSWRKTLELDPHFGEAHLELGKMYLDWSRLRTFRSDTESNDAHLKDGVELCTLAVRECQAAEKENPGPRTEMHRLICEAFLEALQDRDDPARRIAEAALVRFAGKDGSEELHLIHGEIAKGRQVFLEDLEKALRIRPKFWMALFVRSSLAESEEVALADLSLVIEIKPRMADAYSNRGGIYIQWGRMEEALKDFNLAVEYAPKAAWAYLNRGHALTLIGDADAALRDFNAALSIEPNLSRAHTGRANVNSMRREFDAALVEFDKGLKLEPGFAEGWSDRGYALMQLGRHRDAIASFDQALTFNPRCPEAYHNRALVKEHLGDVAGAIEDLEKALAVTSERHPRRGEMERKLKEFRAK